MSRHFRPFEDRRRYHDVRQGGVRGSDFASTRIDVLPQMWYSPHDMYMTMRRRGSYLMRSLDRESPVPLYYQLKEILLGMVDDGDLAPGDLVPSERDICDRFSISRMTASKAVSALVDEGVFRRERGRGTFVSYPRPPAPRRA